MYYSARRNNCNLADMTRLYLTLFLVSLSVNYSAITGQPVWKSFWVTPENDQQCNQRLPCNTVEGYQRENKSIFSAPNSEWNFLNGYHYVKDNIQIQSTGNIIWKGVGNQCVISFSSTSQWSLDIVESYNIVFHNLILVASFGKRKMTIGATTNVTLDKIQVKINSLIISNPKGMYFFNQSEFSNVNVSVNGYRFLSFFEESRSYFNFSIKEVQVTGHFAFSYPALPNDIGGYHTVNLTVDNSHFLSGTTFTFHSYPVKSAKLMLFNSVFLGDIEFRFSILPFFETNVDTNPVLDIHLDRCDIRNSKQETIFLLILIYGTKSSSKVQVKRYIIPKLTITDSHFQGVAVAVRNLALLTQISQEAFLKFERCIFTEFVFRESINEYINNKQIEHANYNYVIILRDLWFPVILSNSRIIDNKGGAIFLSNSQLLLRGNNFIERNGDWTTDDDEGDFIIYYGIVCLIASSKLLLENNSKLEVKNNTAWNFGGIALPPLELIYGDFYTSYNQDLLFNCLLREEDNNLCSGLCFFQLFDEQGNFLFSQDISQFSGKVILKNNTVWEEIEILQYNNTIIPHPQLFNGHLLNCILQTKSHVRMPAILPLIKSIFQLPSWKPHDISSLPYMCLCDEHNLGNKVLWDCNGHGKLVAPPGEIIKIYFAVVKDVDRLFRINSVSLFYNEDHTTIQFPKLTNQCYEVNIPYHIVDDIVSLRTAINTTHDIMNQRNEYYPTIHIKIIRCPVGLIGNINSTCTCVEPLIDQGFMCASQHWKEALFTQKKDNYWIGLDSTENSTDKLLFSDYCLPFYCNNILNTEGVTLKIGSPSSHIQCNSKGNHVGFMCGKCIQGHSTVFGGYKCYQCHGPWYLLFIPLYGLLGLVLIALLFLFNLTIVQGTINGISLYANIIYLYDDYLVQNAGQPFYSITSILNFGLGIDSCFYDGMGFFEKVMIQLIFPIYLLILVVLIVIGAHKFNLKIFRVDFIAKRSVPVLATLMVLTYTNLVTIVVQALRFTTVYTYEANTQKLNQHLVWLYQPALRYFEGKHLILALSSLIIAILYLIPLTMITLFGDCLRRNCIRSLWFSHFLDVFHGAYRWPLGFWLGLRLLIRVMFVALLIFLSSEMFNFLLILFFISFFFVQLLIIRPFHYRFHISLQVEKKGFRKQLSQLPQVLVAPMNSDAIFLLLIVLFSAITLNTNSGTHSVSCVLPLFAAIIQISIVSVYHGWMYLPLPKRVTQKWEQVREEIRNKIKRKTQEPLPLLADPQIEQFPFHHIKYLRAGVPEENNSSTGEGDTASSQKEACNSTR